MNSKQVLEKLPDYEDMMRMAEELAKASARKLSLENRIRKMEADVVLRVNKDIAFFQNGKPLSMSFIEATYKYTGIENEIIPLREQLASEIYNIESTKGKLDAYKTLFEIWRTLSANERHMAL
jgi:hypothetical protein